MGLADRGVAEARTGLASELRLVFQGMEQIFAWRITRGGQLRVEHHYLLRRGPAPQDAALVVGRAAGGRQLRRLGGLADVAQVPVDTVRVGHEADELHRTPAAVTDLWVQPERPAEQLGPPPVPGALPWFSLALVTIVRGAGSTVGRRGWRSTCMGDLAARHATANVGTRPCDEEGGADQTLRPASEEAAS